MTKRITDMASLRANAKELDSKLKEVFAEFGLEYAGRRAVIGVSDVSFKITTRVVAAPGEDPAVVEQKNWNTFAPMYGLPLDAFGQTYVFGNKRYKVVGLDMSRSRSRKIVRISRVGDDKVFIATPADIIEKHAVAKMKAQAVSKATI